VIFTLNVVVSGRLGSVSEQSACFHTASAPPAIIKEITARDYGYGNCGESVIKLQS
jgi:hypothetical protein